jgi:hypothetical protein
MIVHGWWLSLGNTPSSSARNANDAHWYGDQQAGQPGRPRMVTRAQAKSSLQAEQDEHDTGDKQ